MSVRIRITDELGNLHIGDELDAQKIDGDGDAVVTYSQKFGPAYADDDSIDYIWSNYFELIDPANRIQELETEVERLKKLVPEEALLPQENGVYGDKSAFYVRFDPDEWVAVFCGIAPYIEVRTDSDMVNNAGTDFGPKLI